MGENGSRRNIAFKNSSWGWLLTIMVLGLLMREAGGKGVDDSHHRVTRQLPDILGAIGNIFAPKQPNTARRDDPLGALVDLAIQNIHLGVDDKGFLNLNLGPTTARPVDLNKPATRPSFTTRAPSIDNTRPPVNQQNEDCSERNVEYTGDDLNIPNNGVNNKQNNKNRCSRSCRNTPGCNFWVWVHKREDDVNLRKACFLKSNKRTSTKRRRRISGPKSCNAAPPVTGNNGGVGGGGDDLLVNVYNGTYATPPSSLFCKTNFAPTSPSPNQRCVFPFIYNNRMYHGCTLDGATDGKPWCSVRVDANGNHVSGQGLYGQCFDNCPNDFAGTPVSGVARPPFVPGGGGGRPPVVAYPTPTPTPYPTPTPTPYPTPTPPTPRPPFFTPPQPSLPLKECGNNARRFQTKIVGGRPADPNEWPWLAALIRPSSKNSGQYCGGTLISDRFILTAAHCLAPYRKEQLKVTLGEYNFETQGETLDQTYLVSNMKMHENYDGRTYENDIALIKLDRPVTFSKSVYPICLPPRGKSYVNTRAFVIGWGTIYFGGPSSSTLQEVNVRVWDNAQCSANYQRLNRVVTSKMLCAGEEDRDSCQGDSGGPLNCLNFQTGRWELCGVVSWGARCAEPDFPGVYTKVADYLDWIEINQSSL